MIVGLLLWRWKQTSFLSLASNNCSLEGLFSLALEIDEGGGGGGGFIKEMIKRKCMCKGGESRLRVF